MSVHSLIDKFSQEEIPPTRSRSRGEDSTANPRPPSRPKIGSFTGLAPSPYLGSGSPPLANANLTPNLTPHLSNVPKINVDTLPKLAAANIPWTPEPGLLALLGPDIKSFNMGETAFVEALRLKAEQERTSQEKLRRDTAEKNLAVVQLAIQHEVPPHLIPSMCVGGVPEPALHQLQQQHMHNRSVLLLKQPQQLHPFYYQQNPQGPQIPQRHGRFPLGDFQKSPFLAPSPNLTRTQEPDNASTVAPQNFRFGGGGGPPRRPLSPAKIGAAAVASLANPVTPYRPTYKTLPAHQRHFSMPADTSSLLRMERINTKTRGNPQAPQQQQLQSPLGATLSIQVRPLPAQPLHKQTKNAQPPSQESMTSFQHIIQFHHWKPEMEGMAPGMPPGQGMPPGMAPGPGMPPNQGIPQGPVPGRGHHRGAGSQSSTSLRGLYSHKRHKSNDMSIDILLAAQQEAFYGRPRVSITDNAPVLKREAEEDVSMDTSDITITESKREPDTNSETSQQSVGRFPHDILLTN